MQLFGVRVRSGRFATVAAMAAVLFSSACGDDEPVVVINWPEFDGAFEYRSHIPVDQTGLACYEDGDITLSHPGESTFSGSGEVPMRCWLGADEIPTPSGTVTFGNGQFGDETTKGSWSITWEGRPGWTYSGEVYWATPDDMIGRGSGTAVVDLPDGSQLTRTFSWTICRRFLYQNDAVEQACDYS